ncbi:MAG TPA: cation-translocating P-type ATPase, partial [Patescibacteria group bacterium]|nr:cation-translocating P-type ATPase [Patescibacteria group bacterium]
ALSDETRPEASDAVRLAQRAGIRVVMVTGDHPETAATVAKDLGILGPEQEVLSGSLLARMTSDQLRGEVSRYSAYARVDPADKVKIVRAWQQEGEIVAMTGDGVNDAPALRVSDIGVAMGSGSDVSRDAASIVLADDNFATLVGAIREGRGIFENLQKVVRFLLNTNISELFVMTAGFLVFGNLGEPLLPVQILWVNLVTDGLPVLALAADPPSHDLMQRSPVRNRSLVGGGGARGVIARAAILACAPLAALVYGHFLAGAEWPRVQTIVFTSLVVVQVLYAFVVRAEGRSRPLRGSRALALAALASFALQLGVVYLPAGNELFNVVPLPPQDWLVIAALSAAALLVVMGAPRLRSAVARN